MRISVHFGGRGHHGHGHRHYRRLHHRHCHNHGGGIVISSPKGMIIMGIILLAIATILFFAGNHFVNSTEGFVKTEGYVVDYHETWDRDNGYMYSEIVEYIVNGQTYVKSSTSSSTIPKPIGSKMTVEYNPRNPKDSVVGSASRNIMIYVIGGIFGIVGFFILIKGIKDGMSSKHDETIE